MNSIKEWLGIGLVALVGLAYANTSGSHAVAQDQSTQNEEKVVGKTLTLKNGDKTLALELVENAATRRLMDLCADKPISVKMHAYGGFEMVGALPEALPTSDKETTTAAGDVVLYSGDQLVIFYGQNRWAYTRLGKIANATAQDIKAFFGRDQVTLEVSLSQK